MTVKVTTPAGVTSSLGTFTTDTTGGTFTTYTPTTVGNYSFQLFYAGQQFAPPNQQYYNAPSQSEPAILVVTTTPRGGLPNTPLPTAYWETPVNSENIYNWAALDGGWMGYSTATFANTGGYNDTGNYNPYTIAPDSAHITVDKTMVRRRSSRRTIGNTEQSAATGQPHSTIPNTHQSSWTASNTHNGIQLKPAVHKESWHSIYTLDKPYG